MTKVLIFEEFSALENFSTIAIGVQCKHKPDSSVPREEISTLRGDLRNGERGIFVTSGKFSKSAIENAADPKAAPITLINGDQLVDLLLRYKIGVVEQKVYTVDLNFTFWADSINDKEIASEESTQPRAPIEVGFPLGIFARHRSQTYFAEYLETGEVKWGEITYSSVSSAGIAVTGWKSCNGWQFWYFTHPVSHEECSLNVLREKRK